MKSQMNRDSNCGLVGNYFNHSMRIKTPFQFYFNLFPKALAETTGIVLCA